jgi:hypothetical protein
MDNAMACAEGKEMKIWEDIFAIQQREREREREREKRVRVRKNKNWDNWIEKCLLCDFSLFRRKRKQ